MASSVPGETPLREPPAGRVYSVLNNPETICLLLAAITLFTFRGVWECQFINYDDPEYVTNNPHIQGGLSWSNIVWAFSTFHASNWHPVTWLSHMLDVEVFGKSAAGPHAVNLFFHAANSVLLFGLLRQASGAQWRSALVAGLFALHPLHVESVAWISERKDVLSTFFGLLTLLTYVRYAQARLIQPNAAKSWYVAAVCLFVFGLMSKPMLVTVPFLMMLLDYWPLQRLALSATESKPIRPLVVDKIPFLLLSLVACLVTVNAQKGAIQPLEHLPMWDRVYNAVIAYLLYIYKTVWPTDLALPYLHPGRWPTGTFLLAAVVLAGLCIAAYQGRHKRPFLFVGWFWFLGTLVPVIGLVQVGAQSMADRYTYVPLIGLFIMLSWTGAEIRRRFQIPATIMIGLATAVLAICAGLTSKQVSYWTNSERLFRHAAAVTENNFIAVGNVGGVLFESGRIDEALEFYRESHRMNPQYPEALNSIGAVLASKGNEEAVEWFQKALAVQPAHADALFNMGNVMTVRKDYQRACEYYAASLKAKPTNHEARNNLANALVKLGRIDEAIVYYRSALENDPKAALIHKNLGEMLAAKGRVEEAIAEYRQALLLTNDAATRYSLGMTLAFQGHWDEAIDHYRSSLRLSPTNAEAQYNLGYALRVKGRLDQAIPPLREALRLQPEFPLAHFNLGCVLADQGTKDEAIRHLREAVRQKPDYKEAQEKLKELGE